MQYHWMIARVLPGPCPSQMCCRRVVASGLHETARAAPVAAVLNVIAKGSASSDAAWAKAPNLSSIPHFHLTPSFSRPQH
jgi:hypothetical protein